MPVYPLLERIRKLAARRQQVEAQATEAAWMNGFGGVPSHAAAAPFGYHRMGRYLTEICT